MKEAYFVAEYMYNKRESKKYGSYLIYEDDKIKIVYDTYYPNLDVYVKTPDGEKTLVLLRSGHGYNQEYHSGKWEDYIRKELYPRALKAKQEKDIKDQQKKEEENKKTFGHVPKEIDNIFETDKNQPQLG